MVGPACEKGSCGMIDLSSTLFFKGAFEVSSLRQESDLLWALLLKIRAWMVPKWERNGEAVPNELRVWSAWKMGRYFSSENELVRFKSVHHRREDGMEFWAGQIIECENQAEGCAPRDWTTEIGYQQQTADRAQISIVIYYSDRPGFIGPCQPAPEGTTPRLIRLFCRDAGLRCTVDGHPFTLQPTHLAPGDFPSFWKLVSDETRQVPVVYISPGRVEESNYEPVNLLDPARLSQLLGPNALVYYADDPEFSQEMGLLCPHPDCACYTGQVRVYAPCPHMDRPADALRHRLIGVRAICDDPEGVYAMLRRALAQDVHFYEQMFRMENCRRMNELAQAQHRQQEYRAQLENELLESAVEKEQQLQQQLEAIDAERFGWEQCKEEFQERIDELSGALHRAETLADSYRDAAILSGERKAALDKVRLIAEYPETPRQIAEYFLSHFSDRLAFTRRGMASLDSCTTSPEVLWDALYQMVTLLFDLYEDDTVVLVDQTFNSRSNLRLARGEGTMTRKSPGLMRNYRDTYDGHEIDIQAHIKTAEARPGSPKFLRIYFFYDAAVHKIIVGSCGEHLENYSTQKVH